MQINTSTTTNTKIKMVDKISCKYENEKVQAIFKRDEIINKVEILFRADL